MNKYLLVISGELKRNLTYRGRVVIWVLVDLVQVIIFPFLWLAIYGERNAIAGLTRADIVTYYIVVFLISLLITSHAIFHVQEDIQKGNLNQIITKPLNYLLFAHIREFGYKICMVAVCVPLFIFLRLIFPEYLNVPNPAMLGWMILFLLYARLISYSLQMIVGLGTFWLGETKALSHIRFILERTFSGEFAPLSFFPLILQTIAASLPFQYLYFIPAQVYLGKVPPTDLVNHAIVGGLWVVVALVIINVMWWRGLKRYEGVGI